MSDRRDIVVRVERESHLARFLDKCLEAYDKRTHVIQHQSESIIHTQKEILRKMATQEERLQAISAKISEVLQMLADLKANNPQIEDEIAEIEAKLAPAEPPA